jgi:hypothetical protein
MRSSRIGRRSVQAAHQEKVLRRGGTLSSGERRKGKRTGGGGLKCDRGILDWKTTRLTIRTSTVMSLCHSPFLLHRLQLHHCHLPSQHDPRYSPGTPNAFSGQRQSIHPSALQHLRQRGKQQKERKRRKEKSRSKRTCVFLVRLRLLLPQSLSQLFRVAPPTS